MKKKQFKAESKRLLDMMIHSIYSNKEIFLRELISNASDAIDKLYYRSLTDKKVKVEKEDFKIKVEVDKENRLLIIEDNGCGMTAEELENNLGTIAESGSFAFKQDDKKKDIDIIGQFGVGFYSAFMVSDQVTVESKSIDSEKAYRWTSTGADGYSIEECDKKTVGTKIILKIKQDEEEENYSDFLENYRIQNIIRKYSDYIRYPIQMEVEHRHLKEESKDEYESHVETETINSMIPLWKKNKSEITEEEYNNFYHEKYMDYEDPIHVIHTSVEGQVSYNALLYIPSHASYDYYSKEYEKGLNLYTSGVMIMEKCGELLPDYFSFVKGLVDSNDLSLNISRELLQQDRRLGLIAKNIEKKIKNELESMLENDREKYEKFFKAFGMQLKFGVYNNFGMDKDKLKDLILFHSSTENKLTTFKEYVSRMKEKQEKIYYACGESIAKIDLLPQVEQVKEKGYEILYLTDYVDEFVTQTLMEYDGHQFVNVSTGDLDLDSEEEKEELNKENEESKKMFEEMEKVLEKEVTAVRFTNRLKNHPVCLTSTGNISLEMEKVINAMPTDEKIKAQTVMEINAHHKIAEKLKEIYKKDKNSFDNYTKVLYAQARLIEGLPIENPTEISSLICDLLSK